MASLRQVVNTVRVNEVIDNSTLLEQYRKEILQLREALADNAGVAATQIRCGGIVVMANRRDERVGEQGGQGEQGVVGLMLWCASRCSFRHVPLLLCFGMLSARCEAVDLDGRWHDTYRGGDDQAH